MLQPIKALYPLGIVPQIHPALSNKNNVIFAHVCYYISDSPYPLVNSKLNGQSYLQFCDLNPTPLKPVLVSVQ